MVASGLSHAHRRPLSCSSSAAVMVTRGHDDALGWPWVGSFMALAVAMMFIGRRLAPCRPCMGPPCAASGATIGRCHPLYWPQRCSLSAVAMATVGHHHAHGRPERCHPLPQAVPSLVPSNAVHRPERCHPLPKRILSWGLALGHYRPRPCPHSGRPRLSPALSAVFQKSTLDSHARYGSPPRSCSLIHPGPSQ